MKDLGGGPVFERFDESAKRLLVVAMAQARERGRAAVRTEDLLAAMAADEATTVGRCLGVLGVGAAEVAACLPVGSGEHGEELPFSCHSRELFGAAVKLAEEREELVSELHLLTALISLPDCRARECLEAMGIDVYWLSGLRRGGLLDVAAVEHQWRQLRLPLVAHLDRPEGVVNEPPSHIRPMTREEVAARAEGLYELLHAALAGTITATAISDLAAEITITLANSQTLRSSVTLTAETGGQLAGVLFGDVQGSVGFIRWVAVAPDARRRGIGAALVDAFEAHTGVERVQGMVHLDDPAATDFWVRRGWRRTQPPRRRVLMGSGTPSRTD